MNDIDHELIERYISGNMEPAERALFESRMQIEPALREAVQDWMEVTGSLHRSLQPDPQREELEKLLQSHRHVFYKAPAKVTPIRRYMLVAASAAAVIAAVLFWGPWQPDLYQQYAVQEMVSPAERGTTTDSLLQQAAHHFNHRQYTAAISLLSKVLERDSADAYARYYRGLSYLENDKPAEARPDLEAIFNGESVFKYESAFYIALSYLKEKKKDPCRDWLMKIPTDAQNYDKAQNLLKEL